MQPTWSFPRCNDTLCNEQPSAFQFAIIGGFIVLILSRAIPVMLTLTIALFLMILVQTPRKLTLGRKSGAVLFGFYLAYTALLISNP